MGNELYEIVGVLEEPFTGTSPGTMIDIFVPTMMHSGVMRKDWTWHRTLAMVKPGAALEPLKIPHGQQEQEQGVGGAAANAFTPIITKLNEFTTAITNLGKAWQPVMTAVQPFTTWIGQHLDQITRITTDLLILVGVVKIVLLVIAGVTAVVATVAAMGVLPFIASVLALALAAKLLIDHWQEVEAFFKGLPKFFSDLWKGLQLDWDNFKKYWESSVTEWKNGWQGNVDRFNAAIKSIGDFFQDLYDRLLGHSIIPDIVNGITDAFNGMITTVTTNIQTFAGNIVKAFTDKIDEIKAAGTSILNGLWDGINSAWTDFREKLVNLASLLPDVVKKILGIASPSTVFHGIGQNMMLGLAKGILDSADLPNMALSTVSNRVSTPSGRVGGNYVDNSVNHYYGPSMPIYTNNSPEALQQSAGLLRILAA
jgi:ABC-type transporter Mla subunit MlaD